MERAIIRLQEISLINFKNVKQGTVSFPNAAKKEYFTTSAEIVGIYGQNGSGKTAVVDAMQFFKQLASGESMRKDSCEFILFGADKAKISLKLAIQRNEEKYLVYYSFTLQKDESNSVFVSSELMKYKKNENELWSRLSTIIDYKYSYNKQLFFPAIRFDEAIDGNEKKIIDFHIAKEMAVKDKTSFLFSEKCFNLLQENLEDKTHKNLLKAVRNFARMDLFVVENRDSAFNALEIFLPVNFSLNKPSMRVNGSLPIMLSEPTVIPEPDYKNVKNLFDEMNLVISTIIPGLSVGIKEYGDQLLDNGDPGFRFELLSKRNDVVIPLRYESEGIRKIISVLSTLIAVYNRPSICVVVDELDAGIFEYLLGEILQILEQSGQGQLLFTSHNLRPLEMLDKKSLVFTTTNPENRYIRLVNIKDNNNMRDFYLRGLNVGGQKEFIYHETNRYEISRAFRKAGEFIGE